MFCNSYERSLESQDYLFCSPNPCLKGGMGAPVEIRVHVLPCKPHFAFNW